MTSRRTFLRPLTTDQLGQKTSKQVHFDKAATAGSKRTAEGSLAEQSVGPKKRTAFGDLTNAKEKKHNGLSKKPVLNKTTKGLMVKNNKKATVLLGKQRTKITDDSGETIDLTQDSQSSSQESSGSSSSDSEIEFLNKKNVQLSQEIRPSTEEKVPDGVDDVDAENRLNTYEVPLYVRDIFEYYKQREEKFMVSGYLDKQSHLTTNMRAILVDWLVEVQENFELNHETLYLAVKLVDLYLTKVEVTRENLQLVGSTAMFIAAKFDERVPPALDDFLYICDDAYNREELVGMEMSILKTVDFDLGVPLSYSFLRRFAKCARAPMNILTLARYILETSLMDYQFIQYKDSEMAAACLLLALKMKKTGEWSKTMIYYTGYNIEHLMPIAVALNTMLTSPSHKNLNTIKSKYSHSVFFEVALTPPVDMVELTVDIS
ncbi:G2/mitotic-specific cyclin-B3 [Lingula anatina]|uniref:G2/mitotic-specific cyclin-B3 n=1 Tax=Lingula anatina TaxID=7574 RepID=A0A1S3ITL7_LINAN|nr:G2/mitotic-specific cyclin-B3 [Lingula anatina]|eukprot:XP_013401276.1 G2/mitotic-specific cyclin-B3 [Lingula anatina]